MQTVRRILFVAAGLLLGIGTSNPASAQVFDPAVTENVQVVELITSDDDGDLRETKLWIVVIDGEAFLRTNKSNWLANLRRDPAAKLRVGDAVYPVRGEVLGDPAWVAKVDAATAEKYGWQEKTIHLFRISEPTIVRLHPN